MVNLKRKVRAKPMSNGLEKDQSVKHIDWEKEEFAPLDTKRPTIPKIVAKYIDESKEYGHSFMYTFINATDRIAEWLDKDDENVQTFLSYYRNSDSIDIEKTELYVIKAPQVWDERRDVYLQHIGTAVTGWVEMTGDIDKANTYTFDEAQGYMQAFGINWFLVKV